MGTRLDGPVPAAGCRAFSPASLSPLGASGDWQGRCRLRPCLWCIPANSLTLGADAPEPSCSCNARQRIYSSRAAHHGRGLSMALYWLHVNKPSATATLHVEGGCRWVAKARARFLAGLPYSDTQGDRHGFWEGPFTTRASAETA